MSKRISILLALCLSAAPTAASAAPVTTTPASPRATAAPASVTLHVAAGMRDGHHQYVVAGDTLPIEGMLKPRVRGQEVLVEVFNAGRRVAVMHAHPGKKARFLVSFRVRSAGSYMVRAKHVATSQQAADKARSVWFTALGGYVSPGAGGVDVRLLQRGLASLGYATPQSGRYDGDTELAVLAFRSVNFLPRTFVADYSVFGRVFRREGAFPLRYASAGRHVEFSWTRQALVLADHGRPELTYHTSSGKPSTPTVFGTFSFYRKEPGVNSHGMYDSVYFIGGYAIHGYPDVPTYPASHGCIRVPNSNAPQIYNWIQLGERIFVYQ